MARTSGARSSDRVFFNSRLALAVGFGGLLSIMALAGIDALNVLQQFRRGDAQIRRRYLSQNHVLLNDIRSDVYVSGTYVRDYLREPDTVRADAFRASLEEVRRHMESSLESYRQEVAPTEAKHYSALRAELMDYWGILTPIFKCDPAERRRLADHAGSASAWTGFGSVHQTKGMGLLGIQERVTRLGGKYKIHSLLERGTILSVELPFTEENTSAYAHETNSHPVG